VNKNKVFKFGCVTFTVIDDVAIAVMCSTPESMDILGIYLADVRGSGRRGMLDVGAGDGKGVVRWFFFVEGGGDRVPSSSLSVELSSVISSRASSWEKEGASVEWMKSSL